MRLAWNDSDGTVHCLCGWTCRRKTVKEIDKVVFEHLSSWHDRLFIQRVEKGYHDKEVTIPINEYHGRKFAVDKNS